MNKLVLIGAIFALAGCGVDGSQSSPPVHVQSFQERMDEGNKVLQEARAYNAAHPHAPVEAAPTQTTQPVVDDVYPAECNTKRFSLMNLYSAPNDHSMVWDIFSTGARGKAWLAVFGNGNYEILGGKLLTANDGSHYCMVQVHISGSYMGNSYDGTYYAMAI
jgi:predicted small lipoprotein YifL